MIIFKKNITLVKNNKNWVRGQLNIPNEIMNIVGWDGDYEYGVMLIPIEEIYDDDAVAKIIARLKDFKKMVELESELESVKKG